MRDYDNRVNRDLLAGPRSAGPRSAAQMQTARQENPWQAVGGALSRAPGKKGEKTAYTVAGDASRNSFLLILPTLVLGISATRQMRASSGTA